MRSSPRVDTSHSGVLQLASISMVGAMALALQSDDPPPLIQSVEATMQLAVLEPEHTRREATDFVRTRLAKLDVPKSVEAWDRERARLRTEIQDRVVRGGAAASWRGSELAVRRLGPRGSGPGYRMEALIYEILPGMWIPALLYRPEPMLEPAPVMVAFTGHEPEGFATKQLQLRSINLAQRGVVVLAPEWFGQGNLSTDGFLHERAAYLDLVGTPGVSVFYRAAERALDVALGLEGVDPERVGVSGLSGGGWQSLLLAALDPRVRLIHSVAGFSTFETRLDQFTDLGDFEQLPADLGTIADYSHLTALLAPRVALLGYNRLDDCCFHATHALPPILDPVAPVFELLRPGRPLPVHIDETTPTHNFDRGHRETLYELVREAWFSNRPRFETTETDQSSQLRRPEELRIELPEDQLDIHELARRLAGELRREAPPSTTLEAATAWQERRRAALRTTLRLSEELSYRAVRVGEVRDGAVRAQRWRLALGPDPSTPMWTVPLTQLESGRTHDTVILLGDGGRSELAAHVAFELSRGRRVIAVDPFLLGDARVDRKPYRFALLISTVGSRALGLQVQQLQAVARWARGLPDAGRLELESVGPRSSVSAMLSAALSPELFEGLTLVKPLGSLEGLIERKVSLVDMPELFCFDLLATTEVDEMLHLVAPRPLAIFASPPDLPSDLPTALSHWYALLGRKLDSSELRRDD